MNTELQKIIDDCKTRRNELAGIFHSERESMALNYLIDRLEALPQFEDEPCAWGDEDGDCTHSPDLKYMGYTIPLYKMKEKK